MLWVNTSGIKHIRYVAKRDDLRMCVMKCQGRPVFPSSPFFELLGKLHFLGRKSEANSVFHQLDDNPYFIA